MASEKEAGWPARIWAAIGGGLVALVGLAIAAGGGWLIALQGSPYYLLAGVAVLATGVLAIRRHPAAGFVYAGVLVVTLGWAVWEAGLSFWPLAPRLIAPAVLGVFLLLVIPTAPKGRLRHQAGLATAAASLVCLGVVGSTLPATYTWGQAQTPAPVRSGAAPAAARSDWRYYGRDPGGTRYAPVDQINRENIDKLKVAWTFRTGEKPNPGSQDQNTPLQVGDTLYVCTPTNVVIAVDADTGKEKWRHDPHVKPSFWNRCRGVGYWDADALRPTPAPAKAARAKPAAKAPAAAKPAATAPAAQPICKRRIISSTINAQLFALDADTGQPCPGFGKDGMVDLKVGMGEVKPGYYFQTSIPTVVAGKIIIGGWVMDNRELAEPSGVVRAFDVVTGELAWAWDIGAPGVTKLPPEGQTYTRGTPNVWSTPAFDPELGLVYLPTGNATPDYWGSHRTRASEAYSSSVVALEAATGREVWSFQTVHHDLWDYDVPSQPMLVNFPVDGGWAPALIQLTKRGQIFVLDRRNGKPLTRVVEVRVPGGAQLGEWTFSTQPYSVEMPTIGVEPLSEEKMWGATPIDQLGCRILFRRVRYDGDFTPPGSRSRPSLQFPGNGGGMNWGSGSYDARRGLLIVSDIRLPQTVELLPADKPDPRLAEIGDRPPPSQKAVSYKSRNTPMLGLLFAPCLQPPHGMLTAIDLKTRQVVWSVPTGTAEAEGPLFMGSGLPIPIGAPGLGGPVTTAGGLTFRSATTDPYLRAYDNATGEELWKARLPVASASTPMTYVSPASGKQYVVVTAGGSPIPAPGAPKGDYVVAYALP